MWATIQKPKHMNNKLCQVKLFNFFLRRHRILKASWANNTKEAKQLFIYRCIDTHIYIRQILNRIICIYEIITEMFNFSILNFICLYKSLTQKWIVFNFISIICLFDCGNCFNDLGKQNVASQKKLNCKRMRSFWMFLVFFFSSDRVGGRCYCHKLFISMK